MNTSTSRQMKANIAKNNQPAQTNENAIKALTKRLQTVISGNRFVAGQLAIDSNNKVSCQYNPSDISFTITLRELTFPFSLNDYNQSVSTMANSMFNFVMVFFKGTDTRTNSTLAPLRTNLNVQKAGTKPNSKPVPITATKK